MKLSKTLFAAAFLTLAIGSHAKAQALPGNIWLGSVPNGYSDQNLNNVPIRVYYNAFMPSTSYSLTAALIRNSQSGWVPSCSYNANNNAWIIGSVYLNHEFLQRQYINKKWVTVNVWKRCSNTASSWPDGQALAYTEYAGSFRPTITPTKQNWSFSGVLVLPRINMSGAYFNPAPIASEWKVIQ